MLKIIAAVAANGVIGRGNDIPWTLRDDLKWFKKHTQNHPVVMGSRTFDSIVARLHKPLPDRENIVLTRNEQGRRSDGVVFTDNFGDILIRAKREDIWVAGGGEIYNLALPVATEMVLTRVCQVIPDGDTFFPAPPRCNLREWEKISSEYHPADKRNEFPFYWETYRRKPDRYIYMPNVRTVEQMEAMQEIREAGVCPFCPEHRSRWHTKGRALVRHPLVGK
jgi:dihydrofolate reductase